MQLFIVDAFTDSTNANSVFTGNPAAVCFLEGTHSDPWLQSLASEMNLSETAFISPIDTAADGNEYQLRWFTPAYEVDLCGHATLASAHTLWAEGRVDKSADIRFHTKSGVLTCRYNQHGIQLDFPATPAASVDPPAGLLEALGVQAVFVGMSKFDALVVIESPEQLRALAPNFSALAQVRVRGIIVTSRSDTEQFDFLSRFFAPSAGINEDPVTGSAHCCLAPYWAHVLNKTAMVAFQASPRGGVVRVALQDDRVVLSGQATSVLRGVLLAQASEPNNATQNSSMKGDI